MISEAFYKELDYRKFELNRFLNPYLGQWFIEDNGMGYSEIRTHFIFHMKLGWNVNFLLEWYEEAGFDMLLSRSLSALNLVVKLQIHLSGDNGSAFISKLDT